VVHVWVSSTHRDGDFFVTLEEVEPSGRSHYLTEGALRASYRGLTEPPFDTLGLPYHSATAGTVQPLPDHPVELVIDLMATAVVIDAGHRLRLTINGADRPDFEAYPDPAAAGVPVISVHRGLDRPSSVDLPVCNLAS
jgi:putative CocE/NonD family hydrolase